jgi:Ca2+-binding EF-hand superfamily protein
MCRAPFHHHVPAPNPISDSQAWFKFVDADGSGTLDYVEMTEALLTCLPCDWRKIETEMDSLFTRWSKGGKISLQDFSKPDGALAYIRTNFRPTGPRPEAPDIRTNRAEWFRYWDVVDGNGNGKLEKGEICRALIKTLHLKSQQQKASIADTLDNIWCLFDHDGSGEVDQAEFIAPEGLAETLSAELSRMELSNAPSSSASTATAPPFPPAASRVPAHVSRAWACGACTFENAESRATCEICGAGR